MVDTAATDLLSVSGVMNFIRGILNGTTLISTASSKNCEIALNFQSSGYTEGMNILTTNFTVFGVFNAIDKFLVMPYHWFDITDKCYDSLFDAMLALDSYTAFTTDPSYL